MQFKTPCLPVCLFILLGPAFALKLNEDKRPHRIPLIWSGGRWEYAVEDHKVSDDEAEPLFFSKGAEYFFGAAKCCIDKHIHVQEVELYGGSFRVGKLYHQEDHEFYMPAAGVNLFPARYAEIREFLARRTADICF